MKQSLFPIIQLGKYGFINEWGEIVIKPQFDVAKRFSEDLARAKIAGKWGFIDESGKFVIEPFYQLDSSESDNDRYLDFHEGRAAFSVQEGKQKKWGYLNKNGEIVILPSWDSATEFSDGIARVSKYVVRKYDRSEVHTSESFYIDAEGQLLNLPNVGELFSEGLAKIRFGKGRDWENSIELEDEKEGYIDKQGNVVIEPERRICESFSEGLARVRVWSMDEWGFIDKKGKLLCEMKFKKADDFNEELARVLVEDVDDWEKEIWGFIDQTGDIAIQPTFAAVGNFSNGVASAAVVESVSDDESIFAGIKCGYIDRSGGWIIEPRFTMICGDFQNELALVAEGQKWGYINQTGKYIWSSEEPTSTETEHSVFAGFSIFRETDDQISNYPMGFEFKLF